MLLRVQKDIDPYILLAYLRLPSTQQQIQSLIRGKQHICTLGSCWKYLFPQCSSSLPVLCNDSWTAPSRKPGWPQR